MTAASMPHPAPADVTLLARPFEAPRRVRTLAMSLTVAGAAIVCAGLFFAPERLWPNLLLATWYLAGVGVAGLCFLALAAVTNAGWSAVLTRPAEALTAPLPAVVPMVFALAFGIHTLYEWSHEHAVAADTLLRHKSVWLTPTGVVLRGAAVTVLWTVLAWLTRRRSRLQDADGDVRHTRSAVRLGALTLVLVALTYCLASFDWIMSLEPHWFSTVYGLYHLSGMFQSGLAALAVLVILLRRAGAFGDAVHDAHLEDLGRLLFAFSTFWAYIWFCQYLLIWYANIPEETAWYILREQGGWLTFTVLVVVFNWAIPFIALLSRAAKRSEGMLLRISVVVLIGRWIDLTWLIVPPGSPAGPGLGLWEAGPMLLALGIGMLTVLHALRRAPMLPVGNPYLGESLAHGRDHHGYFDERDDDTRPGMRTLGRG